MARVFSFYIKMWRYEARFGMDFLSMGPTPGPWGSIRTRTYLVDIGGSSAKGIAASPPSTWHSRIFVRGRIFFFLNSRMIFSHNFSHFFMSENELNFRYNVFELVFLINWSKIKFKIVILVFLMIILLKNDLPRIKKAWIRVSRFFFGRHSSAYVHCFSFCFCSLPWFRTSHFCVFTGDRLNVSCTI